MLCSKKAWGPGLDSAPHCVSNTCTSYTEVLGSPEAIWSWGLCGWSTDRWMERKSPQYHSCWSCCYIEKLCDVVLGWLRDHMEVSCHNWAVWPSGEIRARVVNLAKSSYPSRAKMPSSPQSSPFSPSQRGRSHVPGVASTATQPNANLMLRIRFTARLCREDEF